MNRTRVSRLAGIMIAMIMVGTVSGAVFAAGSNGAASAASAVTIMPAADAYVLQNKASSNYGAGTALQVDGSPVARSYLRFVVSGLGGDAIQSAKLRVYMNSTNGSGFSVRTVSDNSWGETMISYKNAPAPGFVLGSSPAVKAGTWAEVDLSNYVNSETTYSIALTTTSSSVVALASREAGANAPQLVLTLAAAATATGLPTATPSAYPTATATDVPTQTPTAQLAATSAPTDAATATLASTATEAATDTATVSPDETAAATLTSTATEAPTDLATVAPSDTATATPTDTATVAPTATETSAPTATARLQPNWQPSFPIRAAFYYPWFPQAWTQQGIYPYSNYTPQLGYYSSTDSAVLKQHISMMQYGNIQVGIASWWGQGSQTDSKIGGLLQAASGTNFRWALYYELESQGDPSAATIQNDLTYIRDHYAGDPSFLRVNGKFVVFVYADGNDACGMADRWKQGNTVGAYVVLKVFSGYRNCANQPDSWHQYSPAVAADRQGSYSYAISPGFWLVGQSVRLARDLTRWTQNVKDMVASGTNWELVTTFSEWGEGTAVEPAVQWPGASGYGQYLDVLHHNGIMP